MSVSKLADSTQALIGANPPRLTLSSPSSPELPKQPEQPEQSSLSSIYYLLTPLMFQGLNP
jgi:hypothetical protein